MTRARSSTEVLWFGSSLNAAGDTVHRSGADARTVTSTAYESVLVTATVPVSACGVGTGIQKLSQYGVLIRRSRCPHDASAVTDHEGTVWTGLQRACCSLRVGNASSSGVKVSITSRRYLRPQSVLSGACCAHETASRELIKCTSLRLPSLGSRRPQLDGLHSAEAKTVHTHQARRARAGPVHCLQTDGTARAQPQLPVSSQRHTQHEHDASVVGRAQTIHLSHGRRARVSDFLQLRALRCPEVPASQVTA